MTIEWREQAACRGMDTDIFFPQEKYGIAKAKAICARCPVMAECRDYSLTLPRDDTRGVWGGMSEGERVRAHRAREAA